MAPAALIKNLKTKGYIYLCKGESNRRLLVNEHQAKKMAKEIQSYPGYNARAIKSSEVAPIGGEPFWFVMYRKPMPRGK